MAKYHVLNVPIDLWRKLELIMDKGDYEKTPAYAVRKLAELTQKHNLRPAAYTNESPSAVEAEKT